MKFVCSQYPKLAFYVDGERYQFYGGVFALEDYPEEKHEAIKKALAKAHESNGIMVEQEYSLPHRCDKCDKRFETAQARNGHTARAHKTQADIDALGWREGGAPKKDD